MLLGNALGLLFFLPMAVIEKKIWPEYFDAVVSGKKKYELRLNDFDAKVGDTLVLKEWNPETKKYTGHSVEKKITYVGKFDINKLFWPKEEIEKRGLQIFSIE